MGNNSRHPGNEREGNEVGTSALRFHDFSCHLEDCDLMVSFVSSSSFSLVSARDSTLRAASLSCRTLFTAFHPVLLQNVTLTVDTLASFHSLLVRGSYGEQVQSISFKTMSYKENVSTNVSTSNLQSQPSSQVEFIGGHTRTVLNEILRDFQTFVL